MANIRLVPKFDNNILRIGLVLPNKDLQLIAIILLPNDKQSIDDMTCANEIIASLKKRIRKSV